MKFKHNPLFAALFAGFLPMYMSDDSGDFDLGVLGEVMDRSLEDIADLPTYETPPIGRYKLHVDGKATTAKIKNEDRPVLRLTYTIMEVKELKGAEADSAFFEGKAPMSQKFSEQYMFGGDADGNEMSLSSMKARFGKIAPKLGCTSLKSLMVKVCQGIIIEASIGHRADKVDREKVYPIVKDVVLAV